MLYTEMYAYTHVHVNYIHIHVTHTCTLSKKNAVQFDFFLCLKNLHFSWLWCVWCINLLSPLFFYVNSMTMDASIDGLFALEYVDVIPFLFILSNFSPTVFLNYFWVYFLSFSVTWRRGEWMSCSAYRGWCTTFLFFLTHFGRSPNVVPTCLLPTTS